MRVIGIASVNRGAGGYPLIPPHPGPNAVGMQGRWRLMPAAEQAADCPSGFLAMGA
jgi:hypothetical protein